MHTLKRCSGADADFRAMVVSLDEELNERYGAKKSADGGGANTVHGGGFCPYCGTKAKEGYEYCRRCGKRLPD